MMSLLVLRRCFNPPFRSERAHIFTRTRVYRNSIIGRRRRILPI